MAQQDDVRSLSREDYGDRFNDHLIEIYKLYVDTTERTSNRRQAANAFFLSINTAILGAVGYLNAQNVPLDWTSGIAGVIICITWFRIVRAYKGLNTAKFDVIHDIEKMLPLAVFDYEWTKISSRETSNGYRPLSHMENWIPLVFMGIHAVMLGANILENHFSEPSLRLVF